MVRRLALRRDTRSRRQRESNLAGEASSAAVRSMRVEDCVEMFLRISDQVSDLRRGMQVRHEESQAALTALRAQLEAQQQQNREMKDLLLEYGAVVVVGGAGAGAAAAATGADADDWVGVDIGTMTDV